MQRYLCLLVWRQQINKPQLWLGKTSNNRRRKITTRMPAHIVLLLLKSKKQVNRPPPFQKKVQETYVISAPFIFSTPFPTICYQRIAGYGEWCCFICKISSSFYAIRGIYINFSVLHKPITAFAYRIRAPPSEVWLHPSNFKFKGGLRYGR